MHSLTGWFIRNPVAANLIMILILVAGFFTVSSIRIEGFPKLPADTITIETVFPDAYTTQIDEQITQKIEKALEGLDGVKNIRSTSQDGISVVEVQKVDNHKLQKLLDDVRIRLDSVSDLPKAAERPIISRNDFDFPALYVQLYGEAESRTLQQLSREVKEELLAQPDVSRLNIWGLKPPEISVEITPSTLEKYNITVIDVVEKIRQSSLLFETGTLKTRGGHISLRADSQAYFQQDFAAIPLLEQGDGTQLLLGDIATIKDSYEESDVVVRFNGQSAIGMEVLIGRKENLLTIADVVKNVVADFQQRLPPEVKLDIWGDSSQYISERLKLLRENAVQGLFLVALLLALFLNIKLAFWVAMGIPISMAGAIAVMGSNWVDYSLNDVTTFGMIIALGILVDDAVVVGESVFEQRKINTDPIIGTEQGVKKVATATIFGVLTTVAAFFPMLLINNTLGKVLASFAGVVILALLFSLLESKFILPAHLAHTSIDGSKDSGNILLRLWHSIAHSAQQKLSGFKHNIYRPILAWSIKQRYAVLVFFITLAIFGLGLIGYGKIKTAFFPEIPGQIIFVKMQMDAPAAYNLTMKNIEYIEGVAKQLNKEYMDQYQLSDAPIRYLLMVVSDSYTAYIYAELTPPGRREGLGSLDILKAWQDRVGQLEGTTDLTFSGSETVGGGFEIQLFGKDEQALRRASDEVIDYLNAINGIRNVHDTLKNGKPELHLKLKPQARHLGFNTQTLATQIGYRFGGAEAQRIQRDNQEIKVMVRNAYDARKSIEDLLQTQIKSEQGHWLPLLSVASIESGYVTDFITRRNGKRVNNVRAYIDKTVVVPSEVAQGLFSDLVPELRKKYPGVTVKGAGELEEMGEIRGDLVRALIMVCILIYALMAIPLKSYWQPVIIMSVVPFGFVGAAIGHLIMGLPLSLLSFFGMLALTGVVVNDSLVMMTRYNQIRNDLLEGQCDEINNESQAGLKITAVHNAIVTSGVLRFQAVFLTTVTTVAGLMPLMSETSEQAQYLIPAAVSLAYGEIFATAITLILIPVLIAISEDIKIFFAAFKKKYSSGMLME